MDKAVALYEQGVKIVDIENQTGVLRASLYHELKKRKQHPDRTMTARETRREKALRDGDFSTSELLERLIATQRELAETQARLDAIRGLLESEATDRSV